ncbi:hypothetical protein C5F48_22505 [Cereibacter changlensis JA139]|uniref:Uncharacterized protein n=2 Tax=Cereibacter changlensis TaxID=402884 RepID=A0A2T4JNM6_9RHOB|nr:hypothetical protein [Cereibacter changlensis]PTE19514.1 hypothetical protein C5F48_22505 [Cereibacter changlensis JA139]PZX47747.1 hypothetical protein LX76_04395 [Cereibacter changlensis]
MNTPPLDLLKAIRDHLATATTERAAAIMTESVDVADRHWEAFDAAVTPLVDALAEAEERGMLAGLEALLATLAQAAEAR